MHGLKKIFAAKFYEELLQSKHFSLISFFWFCCMILIDRVIRGQSKKGTFHFERNLNYNLRNHDRRQFFTSVLES